MTYHKSIFFSHLDRYCEYRYDEKDILIIQLETYTTANSVLISLFQHEIRDYSSRPINDLSRMRLRGLEAPLERVSECAR